VMLSCALVHMILPSNESLTSECVSEFFNTTFPAFAFFFALMAALSVHLGEFLLSASLQDLEGEPVGPSQQDENDADGSPVKGEELGEQELVEDKAALRKAAILKAKHFSEAVMVEFSLSVHSVLIGITVGVSNRDTLVTLLIALVFHQMFEGMALGARLVDGTIGYWNEIVFALIFAASAPIGIFIGICIYQTFNENAESFLMIQGVFDGICGGILLYTGFLMLFTDFPEDLAKHCRGKNRVGMIAGMFATLWIAAMLMSLIGAWL
jgi:zinc transporter 1/2/3